MSISQNTKLYEFIDKINLISTNQANIKIKTNDLDTRINIILDTDPRNVRDLSLSIQSTDDSKKITLNSINTIQLPSINTDINTSNSNNTLVINKITAIETLDISTNSNISTIQTALDNTQSNLDNVIKPNITSLISKVSDLVANNNSIKSRINSLNTIDDNIQTDYNIIQTTDLSVSTDISAINVNISNKNTDVNNLKTYSIQEAVAISKLKTAYIDYTNRLDILDAPYTTADIQLNTVLSYNTTINTRLTVLETGSDPVLINRVTLLNTNITNIQSIQAQITISQLNISKSNDSIQNDLNTIKDNIKTISDKQVDINKTLDNQNLIINNNVNRKNIINYLLSLSKPNITLNAPTNVLRSSMILNANLTSLGSEFKVYVSFKYKDVSDSVWIETNKTLLTTTGAITTTIFKLKRNTIYNIQVCVYGATNINNDYISNIINQQTGNYDVVDTTSTYNIHGNVGSEQFSNTTVPTLNNMTISNGYVLANSNTSSLISFEANQQSDEENFTSVESKFSFICGSTYAIDPTSSVGNIKLKGTLTNQPLIGDKIYVDYGDTNVIQAQISNLSYIYNDSTFNIGANPSDITAQYYNNVQYVATCNAGENTVQVLTLKNAVFSNMTKIPLVGKPWGICSFIKDGNLFIVAGIWNNYLQVFTLSNGVFIEFRRFYVLTPIRVAYFKDSSNREWLVCGSYSHSRVSMLEITNWNVYDAITFYPNGNNVEGICCFTQGGSDYIACSNQSTGNLTVYKWNSATKTISGLISSISPGAGSSNSLYVKTPNGKTFIVCNNGSTAFFAEFTTGVFGNVQSIYVGAGGEGNSVYYDVNGNPTVFITGGSFLTVFNYNGLFFTQNQKITGSFNNNYCLNQQIISMNGIPTLLFNCYQTSKLLLRSLDYSIKTMTPTTSVQSSGTGSHDNCTFVNGTDTFLASTIENSNKVDIYKFVSSKFVFQGSATLGTGLTPSGISSFSSGGFEYLVVCCADSNNLVVVKYNYNATFSIAQTISAGTYPHQIRKINISGVIYFVVTSYKTSTMLLFKLAGTTLSLNNSYSFSGYTISSAEIYKDPTNTYRLFLKGNKDTLHLKWNGSTFINDTTLIGATGSDLTIFNDGTNVILASTSGYSCINIYKWNGSNFILQNSTPNKITYSRICYYTYNGNIYVACSGNSTASNAILDIYKWNGTTLIHYQELSTGAYPYCVTTTKIGADNYLFVSCVYGSATYIYKEDNSIWKDPIVSFSITTLPVLSAVPVFIGKAGQSFQYSFHSVTNVPIWHNVIIQSIRRSLDSIIISTIKEDGYDDTFYQTKCNLLTNDKLTLIQSTIYN